MVDNQQQPISNQPTLQRVQAVTGIAPVRLLVGHVDAQSAYVMDGHPYGGGLRCRIRYWIDTETRAGRAGWQRFVSQTTNPRRPGEPWDHPKESTYAPRTWMYLDGDGHVRRAAVSQTGIAPHVDAWLRLVGIYDQMPDTDRLTYDELLAASQTFPDPWDRWQDTVGFLAAYLREHSNPPEASDGFNTRDGQPFYIGDDAYPLAAAVARLRLAGVALPGEVLPGAAEEG
jgi:hypothetical protein